MKLQIKSQVPSIRLGTTKPGDGFYYLDDYYMVIEKTAQHVSVVNLTALSVAKQNATKVLDYSVEVIPCEILMTVTSPVGEPF